MWGCCQQLPPAQEQWKMLAKLWSRCLLPSSQQELSPSLCIPFRAQLPAWLGVPTQRGMRSSIQPLHCTEHSTAHTSAGAYDCARNGREHRALVQPVSIPHNFQWISLGCTRGSASRASLQIWARAATAIISGTHFQGVHNLPISPLQAQMHTHFPHKGPQPSLPSWGSFYKGLTQSNGTQTLIRKLALS